MKSPLLRSAALAVVLALAASLLRADVAAATKAYAALLTRYATTRGVRYDVWRASGSDLKTLSEIVMMYRSTDPGPLTPDERKALYINLYNAKILETVLYGNVKGSIKELSKALKPLEIFDRVAMTFDQKSTSLSSLQKKLRDEFKDPRIHFAVSYASKSCPPIRPEPYDGATLDAQLDDAVHTYLALPGAVEVTREGGKTRIVASRIFDWYADDFKASGGPLGFIQKFGSKDAADAIAAGKVKLDFADYDWSLNAAK
jgi:hypothetical protein